MTTAVFLRRTGRELPGRPGTYSTGLLPLVAAPVPLCIVVYLAVTWPAEPSITVERVLGGAMITAAAVGGAIFFPRLTAAVAGAVAAPAVFGLLTLAIPEDGELHVVVGWAIVVAFYAIWLVCPLVLAYVGWLLRRRLLGPALWVGAIMLFLSASGYVWALVMTSH